MLKFIKIRTVDFRNKVSSIVNKCCFGGKYAILTRRGQSVCVIISYWDFLEFLKLKGEKLPTEFLEE